MEAYYRTPKDADRSDLQPPSSTVKTRDSPHSVDKHVIHHFPRLLVLNTQVLHAPVHPSVTRTPHPTLRKIHLSYTSTPLGHHRHQPTVTRILLGTSKHGYTGHVPPVKSTCTENHLHVRTPQDTTRHLYHMSREIHRMTKMPHTGSRESHSANPVWTGNLTLQV